MAKLRPLNASERRDAFEIFYDSIDYDAVAISCGSLFALISATAIGNVINLGREHFLRGTLDLNEKGRRVLIHELAHVWQYQNGGRAYIRSSLLAQLAGWITTGTRRAAYDWRKAQRAGRPWRRWNAEQQAECISSYHQALCLGDDDTMRIALPYIALVRRGEGAPGNGKFQSPVGG